MDVLTLHGRCACARNAHTITLPPSRPAILSRTTLHSPHARNSFNPSPTYLRVPLEWYSSATFALWPDESHAGIRRSYGSAGGRRQFCGFCGTGLVRWVEEEGWVDVEVGSLGEAVGLLEREGLVGGEEEAEEEEGEDVEGEEGDGEENQILRGGMQAGPPFVEEVTEVGGRGRIRRRKGGNVSSDGRTTTEWEVLEIENEGEDLVMEESVVRRESGGGEVHGSKRVKIGG